MVSEAQREATKLFLHGLTELKVDDNGLKAGNEMDSLNAVAFLAGVVKHYARECEAVEDILLYQLADATEALLVAAAVPTDVDVVSNWLRMRAELASNTLGGLGWE
jgi:urease gamma subunit